MKRIFILAICSLLAIGTVQNRTIAEDNVNSNITKPNRIYIEECAREYDVDIHIFDKPFDFEEQAENPTDETCVLICAFKKGWNVSDTPPFEIISHLIRAVYDDGFHSPQFSRKDVESKVKQCHVQEPNDCEFIKCVGLAKPPISEIIGHAILNLTKGIIAGIGEAIIPS